MKKQIAPTPRKATKTTGKVTSGAQIASGWTERRIPLNLLAQSPRNARKHYSEKSIEQLAGNIFVKGLLQNLAVTEANGKYLVDAGERRRRALKRLAAEKRIPADYRVRCIVAPAGESGLETSLVENFHREDMPVADQIEAFGKLHRTEKLAPEEIAARMNISTMTVRRRLKLADLSPKIIDALRSGEATLEQCEALALIDGRKQQEAAFFDVQGWQRSADHIRSVATAGRVAPSDRFARFVGIEAYEQAGGTVFRDLFAEGDEGCYLESRSLLMSLAVGKINAEAEAIRLAEGWKWAEGQLDAQQIHRWPGARIYPEQQPLRGADARALKKIEARLDAIEAIMSSDDEAEQYDYDALNDEADRLNDEANALRAKGERYDTEATANAGAILTVSNEGVLVVYRGLVRPEDARKPVTATEDGAAGDLAPGDAVDAAEKRASRQVYSGALLTDLTKSRTAALANAIAERPGVALACTVHAMASDHFYRGHAGLAVEISARGVNLDATPDADNSAVFDAFAASVEAWRARLPKKYSELWDWCVDAKEHDLLALLAQCVAMSVNAVQLAHDAGSTLARRLHHADQIAALVNLDMRAHWTASEGFLKRIPKAAIAEALTEAGAPGEVVAAIHKAPKGDAAATAKKHLAGWLPQPLQIDPTRAEAAQAVSFDDYFDEGADEGEGDPSETEAGEDEGGAGQAAPSATATPEGDALAA
ncbi:MAG: ParB/RepB/Spo0J family partition protein [Methylocystis sp.]